MLDQVNRIKRVSNAVAIIAGNVATGDGARALIDAANEAGGEDNITVVLVHAVNDSDPGDLRMDGFRISLTYGWHKIVEGQKRLKGGE